MKKIFLLLAAAFAFTACEPEQEDFSNGGHITVDQLVAKTTVSQTGNVVKCETLAPVNAKWTIAGKEYFSNYATKKLKLGSHTATITALCADGTELTHEFPITVTEITDPLEKFWIYGEDPEAQPAFSPAAWDAAEMRFSDNEGKHFPYLSDDVYWGFKTLIFDITDATDDCKGRIMNGWWSARYDDEKDVQFTNGLWELQLTEAIAKDCARGNGGDGKDLDLMVTSGSCTINSVYYEE